MVYHIIVGFRNTVICMLRKVNKIVLFTKFCITIIFSTVIIHNNSHLWCRFLNISKHY